VKTLTDLTKESEFFETPEWAVHAILDAELLTPRVIDAGAGRGVLAKIAEQRGYKVMQVDKTDWAQHGLNCHETTWDKLLVDYLETANPTLSAYTAGGNFSVLMNPPFSLAVQFVERSLKLGARKVVCFQRFAWWESDIRKIFWAKNPPNRIYICGTRATCYRGDLTEEQRGEIGNTPTAHAWFVWERGHPTGTLTSHIYKKDTHATNA
jgi:hypothetical protein